MKNKEELKDEIHNEIDAIIDKIEIIGSLKYFEIGVKCTNGDLTYKQGTTHKPDKKNK